MANALTDLNLYIHRPVESDVDYAYSWEETLTDENPGIIHIEDLQSHSVPITDATFASGTRGLRPESVYTIYGIGEDSHGNTINSESTNFLTKRDYPVFNKMSVGHAVVTSNNKVIFNNEYNQSYNNSIITTTLTTDNLKLNVTDNHEVEVSSNDSNLKTQLNGNLLLSSKYFVNHLTDYSDVNLLDPTYTQDQTIPSKFLRINRYEQIERIGTPAHNHYIKYYDFNSFQPNKMGLIEFNALNKYTGLHSFNDTVISGEDSIYETILPVDTRFINNHQMDQIGSQIDPFFSNLASDPYNPLIDTPQSQTLEYKNYIFKSPDLSTDHQNMEVASTNGIVLNFKDWYNNTEDKYWELDIKANPSSRRPANTPSSNSKYYNDNQNTVSDFDIHFWTLLPPRHRLYYNNGENETEAVSISGDGFNYYNLNNYSTVSFRPSSASGASGEGYSFKTDTDIRRPYLSLVNEVFNTQNNVLGLSNIKTFSPTDSSIFFSTGNFGTITTYLSNPLRATTYILELSSPLEEYEALSLYNYPDNADYSDKFKTISFYNPITESSQPSAIYQGITYSYDEKLLDVIDGQNPDVSTKVNHIPVLSKITKIHELSNNRSTQTELRRISWPNESLTINTLIPGNYYGFRLTAANYCGTSVKTFIFKTKDAEPCTLNSLVYKTETAGTTVTTTSDNFCGIMPIEPGDEINIQSSFALGNGNEISSSAPLTITVSYSKSAPDPISETVITNTEADATSWPSKSQVFTEQGVYTLTIKTPRHQKINDITHNNTFEHVYQIVVSDTPTTAVTTNDASNIDINSVTLNGTVSVTGTHSTSKAQKFFLTTTSSDLNSIKELSDQDSITAAGVPVYSLNFPVGNGAFSYNVQGLIANTTYYYVACAQNQLDKWYSGAIKSFTTDDNANINITVDSITRTGATITFQ